MPKRVKGHRTTKTAAANSIPVTGSGGTLDVGLLATGTPDGTKFIRDDGTLQLPSGGVPAAHATSHQNGGTDEISVTGLSGLLADAQTPLTHTHTVSQITDLTGCIGCVFDGGGSAITSGSQARVRVPFACTITKATVLADQSGSIVVDIWKDTYGNYPPTDADSITAAAPPTLSGAAKSEDSTLTGWTVSVAAGDTIIFNVDSATTVEQVTVILDVTRT